MCFLRLRHYRIDDGGWTVGEIWQRKNSDWWAISYTHHIAVGPYHTYTEAKHRLLAELRKREVL